MKHFALAVLLLFLVSLVFGKQAVFRRFSSDDGLSENTVQVISQDRQGFIWFGTQFGLNKFDGYRFKQYIFGQGGASENNIYDVFCARDGRLWVGIAAGGLYWYDRLSDAFQHVPHDLSSSPVQESVYCFAEDSTGGLWIGSNNGLERFDPQKGIIVPDPSWRRLGSTTEGTAVVSLAFQGRDTLWVGTNNRGVWRLRLRTGEWQMFTGCQGPPNDISHDRISDLAVDKKNRLWVTTYGDGLNLFDGNRWYAFQGSFPAAPADDNLFDLFVDDQTVYIGSEEGGLFMADLDSFQPKQPKFTRICRDTPGGGTSSNNVRAVFRDGRQNLWLGFFRAGVNLLPARQKRFEHFASQPGNVNSLSHNLINDIFEDHRGRIWIGTNGGGLNLFDPKSKQFTIFRRAPSRSGSLIHDNVASIIELNSRLWIGTWGGLAAFDPADGRFTDYSLPGAKDPSLNNIFRLFTDGRSRIWICTYNGLEVFDPASNKRLVISSPATGSLLTSDWIFTGLQDHRGHLWIGTLEGLNRLKQEDWAADVFRFDRFLHQGYEPSSPRPKTVQTLFESAAGELYAGTLEGLFLYQAAADSFVRVPAAERASIRAIFRILEDAEGSLWISTLNGLYKLERDGRVMRFDKSDGLQSNQFVAAACRARDGTLYFGGVNGFNRFRPEEIERDDVPPPVVFTDLLLYNRSASWRTIFRQKNVDEPLSLTIRPNQNTFAFEFAALDFVNPYKCRYAYRMEGLDDDWNEADAFYRIAAYRNLPAGRYIFRVRAANGDGVWNEEGAHLDLEVLPPFWKSNWALLLYISAAGVFLLFFRTIIVTKAHYDAELRLDQLKLNFFTHLSHEFRTPLTLILGPIKEMLRYGEKLEKEKRRFYAAIISRNSERLQRLIDQVMDLEKAEKGLLRLDLTPIELRRFTAEIVQSFSYLASVRRITLEFVSEVPELISLADADKLEKIIYNLISNALNYTAAGGRVQIILNRTFTGESVPKKYCRRLTGDREWLKIEVKDTGRGIPSSQLERIFERFYTVEAETVYGRQGTGVGLALSRQLAELHGGALWAESEEGRGSTFILILPVIPSSDPPVERRSDRHDDRIIPIPVADTASGPLVLIIEDDADMRLYLAHELSADYRVAAADSGREGIAAAAETVPDLIICDVMMPETDGFSVCRMIKQDQRTSHIPVILLTAWTEEAAQLRGLQEGADDYIKKPFDISLLRARIDNLLENRRKLQQRYARQIFLQPGEIELTSPEAEFIEKTRRIIEEQMENEAFSVEELACRVGLSRAQLYRKIHALLGTTPQELIMELRLQRAAQLLGKHLTVAEIAYRLGFSDPSHLSKSFKKRFGCSPSQYRP